MIIIKDTMDSGQEIIRVGDKSLDNNSNTFHHVNAMTQEVEPEKTKDIIAKGRSIGTRSIYKVKGGLPKYGSNIGSRLDLNTKNKLNGLFI